MERYKTMATYGWKKGDCFSSPFEDHWLTECKTHNGWSGYVVRDESTGLFVGSVTKGRMRAYPTEQWLRAPMDFETTKKYTYPRCARRAVDDMLKELG